MGNKFWGIFGAALMTISVIAFFWFVSRYFFDLTPDQRMSPAAVRPIIVIMLILAMLGFGGTLIIRPLFAPADANLLTDRFRLSREIFLVFSGVFATVIGFYFGSLDRPQANGSSTIKVAPKLGDDGLIHIEMVDTGKPYTVVLQQRSNAPVAFEEENSDGTKFRLAFSTAVKECPADLDVAIKDTKGNSSTVRINIDKAALAGKKWLPCQQAGSGAPPASSPPS